MPGVDGPTVVSTTAGSAAGAGTVAPPAGASGVPGGWGSSPPVGRNVGMKGASAPPPAEGKRA